MSSVKPHSDLCSSFGSDIVFFTKYPVVSIFRTCCNITSHRIWNMLVVVNFDALAQAGDFRIERRQVFFPC